MIDRRTSKDDLRGKEIEIDKDKEIGKERGKGKGREKGSCLMNRVICQIDGKRTTSSYKRENPRNGQPNEATKSNG